MIKAHEALKEQAANVPKPVAVAQTPQEKVKDELKKDPEFARNYENWKWLCREALRTIWAYDLLKSFTWQQCIHGNPEHIEDIVNNRQPGEGDLPKTSVPAASRAAQRVHTILNS
jgi:hypothetical protein